MKTANEIAQGGEENYPWKDEPNLLRFKDKATGLYCLIRRNVDIGILCGYVEVPSCYVSLCATIELGDLDVHGGVSFNYFGNLGKRIFIGFDCAHDGDLMPTYFLRMPNLSLEHYTYKDINYVKGECRKLAHQIYQMINKFNDKD